MTLAELGRMSEKPNFPSAARQVKFSVLHILSNQSPGVRPTACSSSARASRYPKLA